MKEVYEIPLEREYAFVFIKFYTSQPAADTLGELVAFAKNKRVFGLGFAKYENLLRKLLSKAETCSSR